MRMNAYRPIPDRPYILAPATTGWLIEDVWPPTFFGRERVAEIKRKVAGCDWARRVVERMRTEAALALAQPPQVPVEPCGWRHDFFSQPTAAPLIHEPDRPDSYLDPTTGQRESDPAQRKAWALLTHERTFRMMRSLGLLYAVTRAEQYATWVADGFRQVAGYFARADFKTGQHSALYFQPLYDAAILALLANSYDLTRASAAYTAADHDRIRQGIFGERVPCIQAFLEKVTLHNMGVYVNAALVEAGRACERDDWVEQALRGPRGWRTQLLEGVPSVAGQVDGFWLEETTFYHFYTLCAFLPLAEAERARHGALDDELRGRLSAMFTAPVELADQQLRLPTIGDLGAPGDFHLAAFRHLYEYAAGQLDEERFGPILAAMYQSIDAPRTDLTALAFGLDELPAAGGVPARSSFLPVTGIGVFRSATPEPIWALFRCGNYRGGHDHPDRLSLFLHAHGQRISSDLGEPGYSLRRLNQEFYRSTLAHNTLFADETNLTGAAQLEWRADATPPQATGTVTQGDVTFRRTVVFTPPKIELVDEYASPTEYRYGWSFRARGALQIETPLQSGIGLPPLPTDKAWSQLTERDTGWATNSVRVTWQVTDKLRLALVTESDAPFEVTRARVPGNPSAEPELVLLYRIAARTHRFRTVLEIVETRGR